MPNPSITYVTLNIDGLWLHPFLAGQIVNADKAWIGGSTPTVVRERDAETFAVVGRNEGITQSSGVVRLDEGTLEGLLLTRHGISGTGWLGRLDKLVRDQEKYERVSLTTPRYQYARVELGTLTVSPTVAGEGAAYKVSLPFRQLR